MRILVEAIEKDHSHNDTVVEYAVRYLFKGKSVARAAQETARKLSGSTNLFIGGGVEEVVIDPSRLEDAIWARLVEQARKNLARVRPGAEDFAIGGVVDYFRLGKADEAKLHKLLGK